MTMIELIEVDFLGEPITQRFGDWYITPTALVYEPYLYDLTIGNLTNGMDWLEHFRQKRWFTPPIEEDFLAARSALLQPEEVAQ